MDRRAVAAVPGRIMKIIHRRDTEFAGIGVFVDQELLTLRPQRLRGKSSESFVTFVRFVVRIIDGE